MIISQSTYKGHPVVNIDLQNGQKPFSFGVVKAHAIVEFSDFIKSFVAEHTVTAVADKTPAKPVLEFQI